MRRRVPACTRSGSHARACILGSALRSGASALVALTLVARVHAQTEPEPPVPAAPPTQPGQAPSPPNEPAPAAQPPAAQPPAAQPPAADLPEPPQAEPEPPIPGPPADFLAGKPAPASHDSGAAPADVTSPSAGVSPILLSHDELLIPGYTPGYRRYLGFGLSPYSPRYGSFAGGITPGFGTATPAEEWNFRWSGFMSVSLQFSSDRRIEPESDQASTVFHTPPSTIDEFGSFVSSNTVPGHWVGMNFSYGNQYVAANVSISTWNPTRPTTYYQIGSQNFIRNVFLTFNIPPVAGFRLNATVGWFGNTYGGLSQYGSGIYVNPITGGPFGAGETVVAEYDLSETLVTVVEHGIMGQRDGQVPDEVIPTSGNQGRNPIFPSDWVHHLHWGLVRKGEPQLRAQAHYLTSWSADERSQTEFDNIDTRALDESNPPDGRLNVYGVDASVNSQTWGYLGVGASLIKGKNAFGLKTLNTYGGDGQQLTERWWGEATGGTGSLFVTGINYSFSLGKIIARPIPFPGDGPDIKVNTGFHLAAVQTDLDVFDGRIRHKYGADVLYTFLPYVSAGVRGDRIVPNSKDSGETFHVLAPRLVFKTDWTSRENLTLLYGRWFYGPRTRSESIGLRSIDRLDRHLFALNFNLYW